MSMGFRANKEHAYLHGNAFHFDDYVAPDDPNYGQINGYIRKTGSVDKVKRLTTSNCFTRDENEFLPIPVGDFDGAVCSFSLNNYLSYLCFIFTDLNDRGAIVHRYLKKTSPGQQRFYACEATSKMKDEFAKAGYPLACMNPKRPLGANATSSYFKQFARKIGIDDWQSFGAHSLRA